MAACHTKIHEEAEMTQANHYYIDRLVKTMIWLQGGFRVYVNDKDLYDYLSSVYCKGGAREFDWDFMSHIYEHEFEIVFTEQVPETKNAPIAMGGHLEGCRIGFDAGGSDRKVSAVIDGETVFSEEVVWFPKVTEDPSIDYVMGSWLPSNIAAAEGICRGWMQWVSPLPGSSSITVP